MALSDAFLALALCQVGLYFILYNNKVRWKRFVGAAGIILIGFSYVTIADSIPMFIAMGISLVVGGIQLLQDAAALVK